MTMPPNDPYAFLRPKKKFPPVWCAGCGIGIVLGSIVRAIGSVGWERDSIAMISGIGCSGRMPVYVDLNTMHTTHGRALAFATGLKLARPEMHVLVVMGDGDALAIGGNHFIHAARRNIGLTTIVINNAIYGMTGGQYSPTTPENALATTAPLGNIEPPFAIDRLAEAAGASFVARSTVYHTRELDRLIELAMRKEGFALVEAVSYCHTTYGRINRMGSAVDMMRRLKDESITVERARTLAPEQVAGKIVRGVLVDRDIQEYTARYRGLLAKAQAGSEERRSV
ncbi:MAG: 2-oxoacid:ferredoxin oxidoreductase subunit beta [Anaerolineae bacterium]